MCFVNILEHCVRESARWLNESMIPIKIDMLKSRYKGKKIVKYELNEADREGNCRYHLA